MTSMRFFVFLIVCCALSCSGQKTGSQDKIELILDWKAQMEHAGFFVAKAKGFYAEAGIDIDILEGTGAPTAARVVGNGTYKFGIASGAATVLSRAQGIPVVSLAVINQHSPVVVYSLAEKNITQPKDLIGKRIGVNVGGTKHREFQAFLRKQNIKDEQIELMGMSEASPAPLLAGQVDAMLGYTEDQPVIVELRDFKVNRISLADYGIDVYSTNIIANESFLQENGDLASRFLKASLKGWQYAIEHPDEAVAAYMAQRPESDQVFNQANFKSLLPILNSSDVTQQGIGAQTLERWTHTQDVLFDLGQIKKKVDLSKLFTNAYR